jgi:biotin carboxyl carrier protein
MYRAQAGSGRTFEIASGESGLIIDALPFEWNLVHIRDHHYHVIHAGKSYRIELTSFDALLKTYTFKINGSPVTVALKDKFDELLDRLGMNATSMGKVNSVKAPMPGLIIDLRVKAGDRVAAGDPLLILEAMKMENVIKAPVEAVLKSLMVKKGDSVEKNQVLLEFE